MIQSMTGYANASSELANTTLQFELRGVNSRYLDLVFRLPDELRYLEPMLREKIAARLKRGKVECRLASQSRVSTGLVSTNGAMIEQLEALQSRILSELPHAKPLSVAEILRWPGVLSEEATSGEALDTTVATLCQQTLDEFIACREREGIKLGEIIQDNLTSLTQLVGRVQPMVPKIVADLQSKLFTRLQEVGKNIDTDRIAQEAVIFAQRADVAEEINRLQAHLSEISRILKSAGSAGKRLDFLMQELNREANTLCSKSFSAELTAIGVDMKVAIEQMREQIQNIE